MATQSRAQRVGKRVGNWHLGRTIGEGTYSKVKYGQHAETGEAAAVKVLDKEHLVRSGMAEQVRLEVAILQTLHHPAIVGLKEVMSTRDKLYLVLELVTGGDLFDSVVADGPVDEPRAQAIFAQLLSALDHCHRQAVFHRDLKPENVLLASDGTVRLSDFGLGALRAGAAAASLLDTACGTPNYAAPEVLARAGYQGGPADIWSLGVVLYTMLAGCLPFDEEDLPALHLKIRSAEYEVPPWMSQEAVSLLRRMIQPDPTKRATIEELWREPWVQAGRATTGLTAATSANDLAAAAAAAATAAQVADLFPVTEGGSDLPSPQLPAEWGRPSEPSPGRARNAFDLINDCLNISAIFEFREDIVTRRTRFTSKEDPPVILRSVEQAAVACGGRVEHRPGRRLRLTIPSGTQPITVSVELFDMLPGTSIVDFSKVAGNTARFYRWYGEILDALDDLIWREPRGTSPDGRPVVNGFAMLGGSMDLGPMLEGVGLDPEEAQPPHPCLGRPGVD